jgi:hypothetical protein
MTDELTLMAGEERIYSVQVSGGLLKLVSPNWKDFRALKKQEQEEHWDDDEKVARYLFLMAKKHTAGVTSVEDITGRLSFADVKRLVGLISYLLNLSDELPKEFAGAAAPAAPNADNRPENGGASTVA